MRLFSVFATAQAAIGDGHKRSFAEWHNCINGGQNLVTVPNAEINCIGNACSVDSCVPGYHRIAPSGEKKKTKCKLDKTTMTYSWTVSNDDLWKCDTCESPPLDPAIFNVVEELKDVGKYVLKKVSISCKNGQHMEPMKKGVEKNVTCKCFKSGGCYWKKRGFNERSGIFEKMWCPPPPGPSITPNLKSCHTPQPWGPDRKRRSGQIAAAHSWPWLVRLVTVPSSPRCSGVIIGRDALLTSAQCCQDELHWPWSGFTVHSGDSDGLAQSEEGENSNSVWQDGGWIHPKFKEFVDENGNKSYKNDVCYVKLGGDQEFRFENWSWDNEIDINPKIGQVCTGSVSQPQGWAGNHCWTASYGSCDSKDIVETQVDILSDEECLASSIGHGYKPAHMVCAGQRLLTDDDCTVPGAPLICQGPNGHAVLVGIESWSSGERGEPRVFTKMETNDMSGWINWMKGNAPRSTGLPDVTLPDSPFD